MFGPDREDRSGNGLPLKVVPQLNGTRPSGTPILRLDNVSTEARSGSRPLTGLGLSLWRGHIHAIVGVDGQGQRELAEVIAGYRTSTGTITLDGQDIQPLSAEARAERGIGMVVDDRLGEAAIGAMSVADNLMLKRPRPHSVAQRGILRRSGARRHARNLVAAWTIEPADDRSRFGTLSGGNMQRVLIAREIDRQPRVLVALNPVQGLDVHTAAFLWTRLRKLCDRGGAVVVFATDLDEALAESDRCAVMFDGRVSAMEPVSQVDRRAYGAMMVTGW
jgi:simple sugar transport system ATP-binding protein